jgi:hypothetical protein
MVSGVIVGNRSAQHAKEEACSRMYMYVCLSARSRVGKKWRGPSYDTDDESDAVVASWEETKELKRVMPQPNSQRHLIVTVAARRFLLH